MTEVAFHTGLSDKLGYTCRLLRKAWRQGARVVVTGDALSLGKLDSLLWTFEHEEFVPHARLRAGERAAPALARTPIWLVESVGGLDPVALQTTVLVNLGPQPATGHEQFARVIELVGDDADDAQQGRLRWRGYQSAGLVPKLHTQSS